MAKSCVVIAGPPGSGKSTVGPLLAEHDGVLSVGGGAVLAPGTRERLRGRPVVFLDVGFATGVQRVGLSAARPLLAGVNPRATYRALLAARLPLYREVATIEVLTDERTPAEIVAAIVAELDKTTQKLEKTQ